MIGIGLRDRIVKVERLAAAPNGKRTMSVVAGLEYRCKLIPMDAQKSANANVAIGQGYEAYIQLGVDIRKGDRITDREGAIYNVAGAQPYKNAGRANHIRATLELKDG